MLLPKQKTGVWRQIEAVSNFTGVLPSWNCDSNCKWYQPDCKVWKEVWCTPEGKFTRCMGFPNQVEAGACIAAALNCSPTAPGGPVPYGACVGLVCGGAGASHAFRCAKDAGII
jgi:hypothetical protein